MRDFQAPGRSAVIAENGMAATSHPLASSTALKVLKEGGNAVDAAVAAAATLAVVEPQMTGIGGDCFAIVAGADGKILGVDGAGRAARGARTEWYVENGFSEIGAHSAHAVTAPGAVMAWQTLLAVAGKRSLDYLLRDAIRYAEGGYPVASRVAWDWARQVETLRKDEGASRHLLPGGVAPVVGQRHCQPALAATLRAIASEGAKAFYEGAIAAEIAQTVQAKGGFLDEEDLAAVTTGFVDPISVDYRSSTVFELPPSGQGVIALIMLNILDEIGARAFDPDSPDRLHAEIEAARLAYSVRDALLGDPDHMPLSAEAMIAREYARALAAQFRPDSRNETLTIPDQPRSDTVYLSVVDKDRTAVSFINSLYGDFGSQIVTPESGIVLQNRGSCFVTDPLHPNAIAPEKRPLHTIIPAMVCRAGLPSVSFGVMGGAYQPTGHCHVLTNMLDYGMDPQAAIDAPRVFWDETGTIMAESGVCDAVLSELAGRGHSVCRAPKPIGGAQAIVIDRDTGFLIAGSDPRKDGCAIGW
ncbi:gamma-glutamyltransferase [Oricola sp.]|uniref:gamma-glutamyltransferase n=1 Tax=Oricola sp. TaxID=1979950 RepID=UPI003BADAA66